MPAEKPTPIPLQEAYTRACDKRWDAIRSRETTIAHARRATKWFTVRHGKNIINANITSLMVEAYVLTLTARGLKPATIHRILGTLSAMGVDVKGCRPRIPNTPKWWLNPEAQSSLTGYLRDPAIDKPPSRGSMPNEMMADMIDWACFTGFRVEETLRLTRGHFMRNQRGEMSVTIPGTKTSGAQKTVPLGTDTQRLAERILTQIGPESSAPLFPVLYISAQRHWAAVCRPYLGLEGVVGATLKALRRASARHLTTNGMPLPILQDYLRHTQVKTTMGYLHLVGGYSEEETRKWLR